jgi:hypothetical protein
MKLPTAASLLASWLFASSASAAADDGPAYFELDPLPNDAIVFLASAIPESVVHYFAVYKSSAPPRVDGVAYFRVEDAADCRTHTVTARYTAYGEDGRVIADAGSVPPDVAALLDAHHRDATEAHLCRWQSGGTVPVVAPDIRSSLDRFRSYRGDAELLARAHAVDAALQAVERLSDTGKFFAMGGDPHDGLMYFDMNATARIANEATVSWVYVPPPARKIAAAYFRVEFTAQCDAQTGERVFAAGFDSNGALVSFSGPSPTVPLTQMNDYARWLDQACNGLHARWLDRTFKSLVKVLDDAHTAMSR